jgi:AcrR family transcriptional regulator
MAGSGKGGRYHHGDLRTALIDTAVDLIGERGVRGFSLAEASRRLGVAVSAPYAHFADREALLAAVTVRAFELFREAVVPEMERFSDPADQLAGLARAYLRFAAHNRALFQVLYEPGLDKATYPEIEAAERPLDEAFLGCVRALSDGDEARAEDLATAVEAGAHGHALLLLDSSSGQDEAAVELAAERAARATLALIEGRGLLGQPSRRDVQDGGQALREGHGQERAGG